MKNYKMIPGNKAPDVMIKEHDRNFWHVEQVRSDIDPNDPRKVRETTIVQCYDTPTFNRIFRPELWYGKLWTSAAEQAKKYRDHLSNALIADFRIVHDPTLVTEDVPDEAIRKFAVDDDMGGTGKAEAPFGHDDLGGAKVVIRKTGKRKK